MVKFWYFATILLYSKFTISIDPSLVQRDSYIVSAGSNISLPCLEALQNTPEIHTLIWFCRACDGVGTAVKEKARFDKDGFFIGANNHRLRWNQGNFSLDLTGLDPADSGEWFCTVNSKAQYFNSHSLLVKDVPSTPGRPLIMSFNSRSVNLSWAPPLDNHNAGILYYIIRQRMGEDSSWESTRDLRTLENNTEFTVHGLQPFTVYSFKVIAVNEMGESTASVESYYMITLREAPSGKPTITEAGNSSATSIFIRWQPPHKDTLHGEFLGYKVTYRLRVDGVPPVSIQLKDPNIQQYTITNLKTFSQYLVSLQVLNPEGEGPKSTVVIMTDEGVPSSPVNITTSNITSTSILISWSPPEHPNGIILGYRLYYMHANFTDVKTVRNSTERMEFILPNLEVYTVYKIWVKAFTWRNEGESSEQIAVRTDLVGPGVPVVQNLTCLNNNSIFLEWTSTEDFVVEKYSVYFKEDKETMYDEVSVVNGTNKHYKVILENLTEDATYWLKLRGFARSSIDNSSVFPGEWSEARQLVMRGGCQIAQAYTVIHSQHLALNLNAGVIAGLGVTILLVAVALLSLAIWRRYWSESYYYLEDGIGTSSCSVSAPDWDINNSVPAHLFIQYVQKLRNTNFTDEFCELNAEQSCKPSTALIASLPCNKEKNRYNNVLAYDNSLVQLKPLLGQKDCEYINANYIDGFQRGRAYIATQGPMERTIPDFWRMIWEQKVEVIVMITNLIEEGKEKCAKYWPSVLCNEIYGLISVCLLEERKYATHTIRTFSIGHTKLKSRGRRGNQNSAGPVRTIKHFQYTCWGDHDTPANPLPLLSFIKKSSAAAAKNPDSPLLVHCSAGVGRTGTYIVIDSILKQLKAKGELSIIPFLSHIRSQRNLMVQTLEQFIFIHDSLAETVLSGETNIKLSYLARYINSLQSSFTTEGSNIPFQLLDRQFSHVTSYKPAESEFSAATLPCNQLKNQSFDFIPLDMNRVCLGTSMEEGSDYINASWLPGYLSLNQFILTQHPKESTEFDFWRLVWEHRVVTVVVLSVLRHNQHPMFWDNQQKRFGNIILSPTEEGLLCGFQTKDFSLRQHNESGGMKVRLIFCPEWSTDKHVTSSPTDEASADIEAQTSSGQDIELETRERDKMRLRLVGAVNSLPTHPIIVMDQVGGSAAGTFCAASTLIRQAETEGYVDVYETAKTLHMSRPGMWPSSDSLLRLYNLIQCHVTSVTSSRGLPDGKEDKKIMTTKY